MNAFKQKMERQLQAKRARGNQPPVGRQPQQASTQPEPEEKDPAEMTPEELDAAIEEQSALVRRLRESELQAAREAAKPRTSSVIGELNKRSRRPFK